MKAFASSANSPKPPTSLLCLALLTLAACTRASAAATTPQTTAVPTRPAYPTILPTASPPLPALAASDTCLPGKWLADPHSLAAYLVDAMATASQVRFSLNRVSGEFFLQVGDERLSLHAVNYLLDMTIQLDDRAQNSVNILTTVQASGAARFLSSANSLVVYDPDYDANSQAEIDYQISANAISSGPIILTPNHFFTNPATAPSEWGLPQSAQSPKASQYTCSANTLTLRVGSYGTVIFQRAE
ncbi:MAG: hypothetical protein OEZ02_02565 [Anaerolineae bacterium]|nr:hypothetical protein [Anaerolineae bacterium]